MTSEPTATRPGPPPLRIYHFLVAMAFAAGLLSLLPRRLLPESVAWLESLHILLWHVLLALNVTGAGFSINWWWKGRLAFVQPGQWLLLCSLPILARVLIEALIRSGVTGETILHNTYAACNISVLLLSAWGVWRIADTWAWRLYFSLIVTELLLAFVMASLTMSLLTYAPHMLVKGSRVLAYSRYLILPLILWSIAGDLLAKRPRFWTHWLGVGVVATEQLLVWINVHLGWLFD